MNASNRRIWAAALASAVGLTLLTAFGAVPYFSPSAARYSAACVVIDATTVEGFVTNDGAGLFQLDGLIRYAVAGDRVTRPLVQLQINALIPPGVTVSLGRARMPGGLLPGETCTLDVSAALK